MTRMNISPRAALLAAALATPWAALAHDTWLASMQRTVAPGKSMEFELTSGERFPVAGSAIARERLEVSACRQGPMALALRPTGRGTKALRLAADAAGPADGAAPGAMTCWVQLAPRALDLAAAKVGGYLDEIDAPAGVRDAWARSPAPKRWKETYTKNAKVIVPNEAGRATPPSPDAPVGLKLEFVVDADLAGGRVRESLPVQVLLDGRPLAGLSVALASERTTPVQRMRTDAQGRVVFAAPQPGRWMLSATDLRPVDVAQGTWESQFTTLVFEVARGVQ